MLKTRHDLVVDASVAIQASDTALNERSRACHAFLETMRHVGHRVVMSREIQDEWQARPNKYSTKWLAEMIKKNRYVFIRTIGFISLEATINEVISEETIRNLVQEDRHLLAAALASDRRVASSDKRVRDHLKTYIKYLGDVGSICWVNPTIEQENAKEWLSNGAPEEAHRRLDFVES